MHSRVWLTAVALALFCFLAGSRVHAEAPDEGKQYDFFKIDSVLYRCDRKTGKVERVILPGGEAAAKSGPALEPGPAVSAPRPEVLRPLPPPNHAPVIADVCGEKVAPGAVTTAMGATDGPRSGERRGAERDIAAYRNNLGLIQALNVQNDRIKGVISVTNRGPRRLAALELTLFGTSARGGEEALEHRFMLGGQSGQKEPPPPPLDASRPPTAVYIPVNLPVPTSGVAKLDVKVTYLKFADE